MATTIDYGFVIRDLDGSLKVLDESDPHSHTRTFRTLASAAAWVTEYGDKYLDIVERKRVDGEWVELETYVFSGTHARGLFKYKRIGEW